MRLAMLAALASAPWSALACEAPDGAAALVSETDGAPAAYLSFDNPPVSKPFELDLTLCDTTLTGVKVDAIMPKHQHGMNYRPAVISTGTGSYRIKNMVFHMPGLWQIQVAARSDSGPVRYVVDTHAQ